MGDRDEPLRVRYSAASTSVTVRPLPDDERIAAPSAAGPQFTASSADGDPVAGPPVHRMLVVHRRGDAPGAATLAEAGDGWRHVGYVYGDAGLVPGTVLHTAPPVTNYGTAAGNAVAGGQVVVVVRDETAGERLLWTWERARPASCTCQLYAAQNGRTLVQVPGACPMHGVRADDDELLAQMLAPRAEDDGGLLTSAAGPLTAGAPPVDLAETLRSAMEAVRDQPAGAGYTPPEWAADRRRRWGPDLRMGDEQQDGGR